MMEDDRKSMRESARERERERRWSRAISATSHPSVQRFRPGEKRERREEEEEEEDGSGIQTERAAKRLHSSDRFCQVAPAAWDLIRLCLPHAAAGSG